MEADPARVRVLALGSPALDDPPTRTSRHAGHIQHRPEVVQAWQAGLSLGFSSSSTSPTSDILQLPFVEMPSMAFPLSTAPGTDHIGRRSATSTSLGPRIGTHF